LQLYLKWDSDSPRDFAYLMLVTVGVTTAVWLTVTLLTRAEPTETLATFYRKVQPEGPGWKRVAAQTGLAPSSASGGLAIQFANWFLGCVLIYGFLFGIGYVIFGQMLKGAGFLLGGVIAGALIIRNLKSAGWQPSPDEAAAQAKDVAAAA
jgi:hypothetical protein